MARLVQAQRALMDTRKEVAAVPKVTTPHVDTQTIGKAPAFTGEHKDCFEWSFQLTAYMGSANRSGGDTEFFQITLLSCTLPWHNCAKEAPR